MYIQLSNELFLDIDSGVLVVMVVSLALVKIYATLSKYYTKKGK